jgi:hypothetical protein
LLCNAIGICTQSWDCENRLIVVTNTASVSNAITRFVYDGA